MTMREMIRLLLGNVLILSSLIFGFAVLTGTVHTRAEIDPEPNQEEIKKIENKLSSEREKLKNLGFQEKDLLAELACLEQEVKEKRSVLEELSLNIRRSDSEVDALRRNLLDLKKSSMEAQNKISKKLEEFYKHARIGYVKVLTDVTDISDFLRRVKYFNVIMAQERTTLIMAAEQVQGRQTQISETEVRMSELKYRRGKEEACLMSLKKELEKRVLLLVNIHQDKKFYETAVHELETATEGLKQTLIDIEEKDAYETLPTFPFDHFKGKLPYPMKGKFLKVYDLPEPTRPGTYKGIIIEGSPSSNVMSIFPGRVAFSGTLKGYGEVVIINHGFRFFTVSAHLSSRNTIEGEVVKEGDVVGRIGGNSVSKDGRLYFEIRRAGKGLKPQEWLKPQ